MAKRSRSQKLGSRGQRIVAEMIESSDYWLSRSQDEDFGIDLEAELSAPEVNGELLKIQIKASESIKINKHGVPCKIDRRLIAYADTCRLPVILVRVDLQKREAWYLWLQQWLIDRRREGLRINELPKSTYVHIPVSETLRHGLSGHLQRIARWQTNTQLVITVNDAVRTAASVRDFDVLNHLVALLDKLSVINESFPINLTIEQALALGASLWATDDGNRVSVTLFTICRHFGDSFSADQIRRMVARDESCSRTGINALAILYDEYVSHVSRLNLVSLFLRHADLRIAYYCNMREKCPGGSSLQAIKGAIGVEFAKLVLDETLREDLFNKWANRGDSVVLDYLYTVPT